MNKRFLYIIFLIGIVNLLFSQNIKATNYSMEGNQPKFPMIMYAVPATDNNFKEVRSWGINYVHQYGLTSGALTKEKLEKIKQYLDLATKYKLKVMVDLDGANRIANGKIDEMKVIVQRFKSHPAVGYWYLFDEPDNKATVKDLQPYYDMIKTESPNIPITICHAWTKNWYKYNSVQDILLHDIYPVSGAEFPNSKLENQTNFTSAAINQGKGKHVIPVLQFFNWKSMAKSQTTSLRGYAIKKLRYPNFDEFRYLCFSTLSQGVNGMGFYSYTRYKMINSNWSKEVASPILNELVNLTDIINTQNLKFNNIYNYKSDSYLFSYWSGVSVSYFIIINSSSKMRNIEIKDKNILNAKSLEPWGQTRKLDIIKGKNMLTFTNMKPWEVIILKEI
ncbi:hypothetical protein NU10_04755 [Flavobacterium dauae]|uniref:hypothetical protein n=1 Tax=Flavobacterium dauae TaxID=1563479 RepID=UPI00101C9B02|nr:hypothetical protein [Flavobacterium dauae]WLD24700.1 hypothetical protein NU10_04755 [Flavobacterium dauae]